MRRAKPLCFSWLEKTKGERKPFSNLIELRGVPNAGSVGVLACCVAGVTLDNTSRRGRLRSQHEKLP